MKKQMKKTLALALVLCLLVSAVPVAAVSAVDSPAAVPEVSEEPEQSLSQVAA